MMRDKFNLTQKETADMAKMSYSTYRQKENGSTEFTISEMYRIARIFNKPIDEIFLDPNSTDGSENV